MAGLPTLVRTGSKSVTVAWAIPDEHVPVACFQAELKASGWHAPWTVHNIFPIDVSVGDGAAELTVHNLEPNTAYQIRLVACFEQGDQHRSEVLPMRTFPLAPPVSHPPTVKCARHDRLLLRWNGPSVQADEIIGYRVSYFDCEQTWSSSTEVEAKFPGRLLTSSEQMSKFLSGAVATRVPIKTSDSDEGGEVEVLFWLMHLTSLRAYKVQVAAVTPGGVGQWSPKSAPLQTWRVAPRLSAPEQILCTHKSVFVALAVEPENIMGQDEEIVSFEVTLTPLAKGDELRVVTVSKEASVQLAGRLHSRACTAPFLLLLDSLKPQSSYTCTARAVSHAGVGDAAQSVAVVTLPAAPDISELQVVRTWHDRVSIAWSVTDRCEKDVISELGEQVEDIGARSVRGFRIRVQQGKVVNETVGVRSRASNVSFTLPCLDQKTTYFVQVAPVTSEKVVGAWSNKVEFTTESLAPVIKCIDVLRVTRCGGILQWAAPEDLEEAPTIGYMISMGGRELDLPTLAWPKDTGEAQVWHEDGVMKATLGLLEPNTAHKIQVAARTVRGLGVKSAERVVQTRPCAPSISQAPILLQAFYNRLVLQCKLIPDWSADEESDVVGYRTRFYECGGFGISAWSEARDAEYAEVSSDDGPYVKLSFTGLVPERCYVAQVAAVTHQGQGPWSKQSERLSTWRAAPEVNTVRVLFRTHTQLVVGWSMDAPDCCDEEVEDFCIRASSRGEPMCMSVSRSDSVENALQWKSAHLQDCGMMLCDDSAEDLTHVGVVSALTPGVLGL